MFPSKVFPVKNISQPLILILVIILVSGCTISDENRGQESIPEDHQTSEAIPDIDVPTDARDVSWDIEHGGKVQSIPPGVAIVSDSGVSALNGRSGAPLWNYFDSKNDPNVRISNNGRTGIVETTIRDDEEEPIARGVVLDTETGEIIETTEVDSNAGGMGSSNYGVTFSYFNENIRINTNYDEFQVFSLMENEKMWETPKPFVCQEYGDLSVRFTEPIVTGDAVVASYTCAEDVGPEYVESDPGGDRSSGVVSFNANNGSENWRIEEDGPEDVFTPNANLFLSSDGSSVIQNRSEKDPRVLDLVTGELLFESKSEIVDFDSSEREAYVKDSSAESYVRFSVESGEAATADYSESCPSRPKTDMQAVLDEGVLVACQGDSSFTEKVHWLEWGSDDPGSEVDLGVEYDALTDVVAAPGAVVVAYERDGEPAGVVGLS